MRRHVAPALPTASIPDPERGDFLPPEGRVVSWTAHWAGMSLREEIIVSAVPEEVEAAPAVEASHGDEAVPFESHPEA